jgi:hypothetical protein
VIDADVVDRRICKQSFPSAALRRSNKNSRSWQLSSKDLVVVCLNHTRWALQLVPSSWLLAVRDLYRPACTIGINFGFQYLQSVLFVVAGEWARLLTTGFATAHH